MPVYRSFEELNWNRELTPSLLRTPCVILAKGGIQRFSMNLDSRFLGNDGSIRMAVFIQK